MAVARNTDVLVIGGGPAGLAAALACRQKGFEVLVADCARPLIDKACGEGLMPDGLAALSRLGVDLPSSCSMPFRGIRFVGEGHRVESSFPTGSGLGIRRTALHGVLVDRAAQWGVSFLWEAHVTGLWHAGAWINGQAVQARWIVGADGQHSSVRRWAGLDHYWLNSLRFGFRRHFRVAPWTDCVEIHWRDGYQIYVTPVGPEEVCVAVISRNCKIRLDQALAESPEISTRLEGAAPSSVERGAVSASLILKRVFRERVALLGDASGSVDAISGEGLCLSFQQAEALASALAADDLTLYRVVHRRLARRPVFMTELMLSLDRTAWLRRRVLKGLASQPKLFARLLAAHVGGLSAPRFVWQGMLPLTMQMLRG